MSPDPDAEERRTWRDAARERLVEELRPPGGADAARPDPVDVDGHALRPSCPLAWAHPDDAPFEASAVKAARSVGRLALARLGPGRAVGEVVADLLDRPDELPTWVGDWLLDHGRAERAALAAAAGSWAAGALAAAGRHAPHLVWEGYRQQAGDATAGVRMSFTWDARLRSEARPSVVLTMVGGAPDPARDAVLAGFGALVLGWRRVSVPPARIRLGSAEAGTARAVEVGPDELGAAVDRVVELVRARRDPTSVVAAPSRWQCARCHLLDRCDEGRDLVGAPSGEPVSPPG